MRVSSVLSVVPCLLVFSGLGAEPASGQEDRELSAREIFYRAPKAAARRSPAAPAPAQPKSATAADPVTRPAYVPPPAPDPAPVSASVAAPSIPAPSTEPAAPVIVPDPGPSIGGGAKVVPAKVEELAPIGLRCSVLKRAGPADLIEVAPDIVFRSGERIRVRVEANDDGYLYIVHQGSSGVWKPLFPSSEVADGDNRIQAGREYDLPPGHVFTFDDQPGQEKLFVVFSRQPVSDLESLIYDLGNGEKPAPAGKPTGGAKLLLAQNRISIGDDVVNHLRNAYARDLIIEKVDDTAAGPGNEAAIYAVSASAESDSRVVVDINLTHR